MNRFFLFKKARRAGHLEKLAGWSAFQFAHVAGVSLVLVQFLVS